MAAGQLQHESTGGLAEGQSPDWPPEYRKFQRLEPSHGAEIVKRDEAGRRREAKGRPAAVPPERGELPSLFLQMTIMAGRTADHQCILKYTCPHFNSQFYIF